MKKGVFLNIIILFLILFINIKPINSQDLCNQNELCNQCSSYCEKMDQTFFNIIDNLIDISKYYSVCNQCCKKFPYLEQTQSDSEESCNSKISEPLCEPCKYESALQDSEPNSENTAKNTCCQLAINENLALDKEIKVKEACNCTKIEDSCKTELKKCEYNLDNIKFSINDRFDRMPSCYTKNFEIYFPKYRDNLNKIDNQNDKDALRDKYISACKEIALNLEKSYCRKSILSTGEIMMTGNEKYAKDNGKRFFQILVSINLDGSGTVPSNFINIETEKNPGYCIIGIIQPDGPFSELYSELDYQIQRYINCLALQKLKDEDNSIINKNTKISNTYRTLDEGISILSQNKTIICKYLNKLEDYSKNKKLLDIPSLFQYTEFSSDKEEFYSESAALTDYLLKLGGKDNLCASRKKYFNFIYDIEKSGLNYSLNKHYGIKDINELNTKFFNELSLNYISNKRCNSCNCNDSIDINPPVTPIPVNPPQNPPVTPVIPNPNNPSQNQPAMPIKEVPKDCDSEEIKKEIVDKMIKSKDYPILKDYSLDRLRLCGTLKKDRSGSDDDQICKCLGCSKCEKLPGEDLGICYKSKDTNNIFNIINSESNFLNPDKIDKKNYPIKINKDCKFKLCDTEDNGCCNLGECEKCPGISDVKKKFCIFKNNNDCIDQVKQFCGEGPNEDNKINDNLDRYKVSGDDKECETKNFKIKATENCFLYAKHLEYQYCKNYVELFGKEPEDLPTVNTVIFVEKDTPNSGSVSITYTKKLSISLRMDGSSSLIIKRSLPHEITHIIEGLFFRSPPPLWFNEGRADYSEYNEHRCISFKSFTISFLDNKIIRLREIMNLVFYPKDKAVNNLFYAQSNSLVEFLLRIDGNNCAANKRIFEFAKFGKKNGWDKAIEEYYGPEGKIQKLGVNTVEELESLYLKDFMNFQLAPRKYSWDKIDYGCNPCNPNFINQA